MDKGVTILKYALTGHTKGFGFYIAKELSNFIGFSRTTGYDITKVSDRNRIINQSVDCEVFINNTCSGDAQTRLLIDLYNVWHNTNKTIVNIGSDITKIDLKNTPQFLHEQLNKNMLMHTSNILQNGILRIKYISWGFWKDSPITKFYPELTVSTTVDQAVKELFECIHD